MDHMLHGRAVSSRLGFEDRAIEARPIVELKWWMKEDKTVYDRVAVAAM